MALTNRQREHLEFALVSKELAEAVVADAANAYVPDEASDWAGSPPATLGEAFDRLAASYVALLTYLDSSADLTPTNHVATFKP